MQDFQRRAEPQKQPKPEGAELRGSKKSLPFSARSGATVVAALLLLVSTGLFVKNYIHNQSSTLGESTSKPIIQDDLPRENPVIDLLFPKGTRETDYDVVRVNPEDSDPSYTYLDRFTAGGRIFRVTQQRVPDNFQIADVAKDFEATDILEVQGVSVYHGASKQGDTQSLIFIKDGKLVSIRSPQKFSDDRWSSYVSSLQ